MQSRGQPLLLGIDKQAANTEYHPRDSPQVQALDKQAGSGYQDKYAAKVLHKIKRLFEEGMSIGRLWQASRKFQQYHPEVKALKRLEM